eukprot:Pgem_evm1s6502
MHDKSTNDVKACLEDINSHFEKTLELIKQKEKGQQLSGDDSSGNDSYSSPATPPFSPAKRSSSLSIDSNDSEVSDIYVPLNRRNLPSSFWNPAQRTNNNQYQQIKS